MPAEDPLSDLLPQSPPPRPDRREAAIEEAMRRFDGEAGSAPAQPPRQRKTWLATPWGRPQLGALLASGIVALVVLPIWTAREQHSPPASSKMTSLDIAPAPATPEAARRAAMPVPAGDTVAEPAREKPVAAPPAQSNEATSPPVLEEAPSKAAAIGAAERGDNAQFTARRASPSPVIALAPPAPPPPPLLSPPPPQAPSQAIAAAAPEARAREEQDQIVVTGARVASVTEDAAKRSRPQARRSSRRGDWNACTVNDPQRSLGSCAGLAAPEGHIASGLTHAWQGDLDDAIAQFGAAIDVGEQPGLAYLNRGIAYERKGDRDRALADLDRAVRQAPGSARAYYNRSLVLSRSGHRDRAERDAERAVELDPRYAEVVR